ncbi:MAG: FAD-dependent pyridine nucleotide-disulfide oxidoreductase [Candidatus Doudnabacteria bacterium]|nr:FAD-dependent pyridine nucleotide-disulfide oxidoreductase [Candidatus Doudnabacteria bacterium]
MQKSKTIIVVGGGYGGINTAIGLSKRLNNKDSKIILVDKQDYHLYYPNLYEVASAEEEFTSIKDLKKSLVLPFKELLPTAIQFVRGSLEMISQKNNTIKVDGKELAYDYLVVALGSTIDFFGIPGVAENSLTMKSVNDALKIKNAVEFLVESHRQDSIKKLLRIVIAGGGFTGVELAGELINLVDIVSWKYHYPLERIQIEIIEGSGQLIPGMSAVVSGAVLHRLKNFDVSVMLNSMITNVAPKLITLNNGEMISYDLLVWTGGVKSVDVPMAEPGKTDRKHRCMTEPDLTMTGYNNIYLIGDNACIMDKHNTPLPQTATQAIMHSDYVVSALTARIQNKKPPTFVAESSPFIIPIKGKWAVLSLPNGFTMTGFIPWLAKIFANVRYYNRLMPLNKAISYAWFETKLYTKND